MADVTPSSGPEGLDDATPGMPRRELQRADPLHSAFPPSYQRGFAPPHTVLRRWLIVACMLFALAAQAGEIRVLNATITPADDGYVLNADFDVDIGMRLEEAVSHGVPLYFVAEFELTRPRWYWIDEHVAGRTQQYRLSYHALTRQYRVSVGGLHQSFDTLEEALRIVSRLRHWRVAKRDALSAGEIYTAALRLKIDMAQLPKPFQVSAIGNKDWTVDAEVRRWSFSVLSEREP